METKNITLQDLIDSVLPYTRFSPGEVEEWAKRKLEEPSPPPLSKRIPRLGLIVKDTEYIVTVEEIRTYFASKEKPKEYVGEFAEEAVPPPEEPTPLATAPKPRDKRATGRKARPG